MTKNEILGTVSAVCLIICSGLNIEIGIGKFLCAAFCLLGIACGCLFEMLKGK